MFEYSKCRLCANDKPLEELISIKKTSNLNENLVYKIYYCFQIQINESDPTLPTCICSLCNEKLLNTYDFIEQVHKAQNLLKSIKTDVEDFQDFKYYDDDNGTENISEQDEKPQTSDNLDNFLISDIKQENSLNVNEKFSIVEKKSKTIKIKIRKKNGNYSNKSNESIEIEENFIFSDFDVDCKNIKWKCHDCSKEYNTVQLLRTHFEEIHKKQPIYECMECSKVIEKYPLFQRHLRNHRNQYKFSCEICGKFSYKKEHHDRHRETHSNERKFMCSICGKYFKTKLSLKTHEKLHLPPELKEYYECNVCSKKLTSQPGLWAHKKLHKEVKEHSCDVCGKTFAQKTNLNQHVALHEEGMPFQCKQCPRKFKTSVRLKNHQIVHTNRKPHRCVDCGKQFRAKQTLNKHKTIHLDYFPFECEYCKKGFKMKELLKVHVRQHTGERPYECTDCNHGFTNWSNYNKHMKSRHGINVKSPVTQLIHDQQQQME